MKILDPGGNVKVEATCLDHLELNLLDMVVDVVAQVSPVANDISLVFVLSEKFIHNVDDWLSYMI